MELDERVARLEAFEAIRQLASRYAAALDRRDMEAVAALFVPDVNVGDGTTGRAALAEFFDRTMR
ncbi:MAG TPA: nuclear transport factor 2 family protein, partial [Acidimicrobiales bacterium]|nr:nuclear transport factor 2 family protein [Acidimicrobiales bacterium]